MLVGADVSALPATLEVLPLEPAFLIFTNHQAPVGLFLRSVQAGLALAFPATPSQLLVRPHDGLVLVAVEIRAGSAQTELAPVDAQVRQGLDVIPTPAKAVVAPVEALVLVAVELTAEPAPVELLPTEATVSVAVSIGPAPAVLLLFPVEPVLEHTQSMAVEVSADPVGLEVLTIPAAVHVSIAAFEPATFEIRPGTFELDAARIVAVEPVAVPVVPVFAFALYGQALLEVDLPVAVALSARMPVQSGHAVRLPVGAVTGIALPLTID